MRTVISCLAVAVLVPGCADDKPSEMIATAPSETMAGRGATSPALPEPPEAACDERNASVVDDPRGPVFEAPCEPDTLLTALTTEDTDRICEAFDVYFRATIDLDAWVDFICVETLGAPFEHTAATCEAGVAACRGEHDGVLQSVMCVGAAEVPDDCDATVGMLEACSSDLVLTADTYATGYDCEGFLTGAPPFLPSPSFEEDAPCGILEAACPGLM